MNKYEVRFTIKSLNELDVETTKCFADVIARSLAKGEFNLKDICDDFKTADIIVGYDAPGGEEFISIKGY